jgi:hypothetical protein
LGTEAPARTSSAAAEHIEMGPGISGGAIAGIVIGGAAGLSLFAVAVFFARRASKYKREAAVSKYVEGASGYSSQHPDHGQMSPVYEKSAQESQHTQSSARQPEPSELPSALPSELPSDRVSSPTPTLLQR